MIFTPGDIVFFALTAWILGLALWDIFHSYEVPLWLSLPPFVVALVFRGLFGLEGLIVAFLLLVGVLVTEIPNRILRWSLSILVGVVLLIFAGAGIGFGWLFFWFCYEANLFGGADVLAGLSVLIVSPTVLLLICLMMGIGLFSIAYGLRRHGLRYFITSFQSYGRLLRRDFPTEEELLATGGPLIFGIFLGAIGYYFFLIAFVPAV